ncbi:ABC transporter permease [Paenibacillus solisilvae]|uniref:ABC transporter permease n=1 Tax=Paenibacillus solisilvae TaxID=2486751 RepID=A0ABW0VRH0_9BACL
MNILRITLKELKINIRDSRTFIFMLLFPIVLILILGLTLTNAFNGNVSFGDMKVLVQDNSSVELSQAFSSFAREMRKSGILFEKLQAGTDGRKEVEANRYTGFVTLTDNSITLYGSSRTIMESNMVQGMLAAFTDKYNAAAAVAKNDPDKVQLVFAGGGGHQRYIKETSIQADRTPRSIDYYALAMTVMIGMWSAISAGSLIRGEINRGTAVRLIAAPVRKSDIFIGKVLGNIIVNMLCIFIIVLFSKFVFKAYWGEHLWTVILVLLAEVVMAASLGLAASYLLKGKAASGVIMMIVQITSMFGGAYFPVDDEGAGFMGFLVKISPIHWGNQALTAIIYDNRLTAALPAIGLYLGLGVLFLIASATMMQRREGL